ncbi:MAG: transcription repressor NadR [Oscillospiraceae bacterium]|nr:transcription repressor NadR [Oscillospiraceae bacterium]
MTSLERREQIREILITSKDPISATALAGRFSVSRQVIVGDIALLRAAGCSIISTPRGYYIEKEHSHGIIHQLICCHSGEQMAEELNAIVDCGCKVINVIVEHPIYGALTGELQIASRLDVECFVERVRSNDALPLSALTEGLHTHTVSCPNEEVFFRLRNILQECGILISAK